jgi:hypothetical protein
MAQGPFSDIQNSLNELFKPLEPFHKQANDAGTKFLNILDLAGKDLGERTIETKVSKDLKYTTQFNPDGDIINEFPSKAPAEDDEYWKRHNELADQFLKERKALIEKAIDQVAIVISKFVNPIDLQFSDMVQVVKMLKTGKIDEDNTTKDNP